MLKLRSNRGKLLLLISRRMRWPALNTLLVDTRSMLYSWTTPGVTGWDSSVPLRYRARMMPSVRLRAEPHASTSTSLAVKSVSAAEVAAVQREGYRPGNLDIGREGRRRVAQTSLRPSNSCWSYAPPGTKDGPQHSGPPRVGTGSRGSYRNTSGDSSPAASVDSTPSPGRGIGPTAAVQVVVGEPGSSQRPFLFVAPTVVTHDENANRRIGVGTVLLAL